MATEKLTIQLERRSVIGKKVKTLRTQGLLPATVYGKGVEPISVQTDEKTFGQLYQKAGRSTLLDIQISGMRNQAAFIQAVQRHPVTRRILHADLRVVDLSQPITVDVPIRLVGENKLVEKGQAMLNQQHATLHVTALPGDLPAHIDIDVSSLEDFDKVIHVSDLEIPNGVTVLTPAEDPVLALSQAGTATAEDEAAAEEAPTEPELVREERDEAE